MMAKGERPIGIVGACDCHAHVFGPFDRFPLADGRGYTPPPAAAPAHLAMLDAAGFDRGVLVHGAAHGWDNGAMLAALDAAPDRLRGIAVLPVTTSDAILEAIAGRGVRGLRFTEGVGPPPGAIGGRLGLTDLAVFAPRLRALGWHAQLWSDVDTIAAREDWLRSLGIPIVFDHLGGPAIDRGTDDPAFRSLLRIVADGIGWVKLTAFRPSRTLPDFADVRPFHDLLERANPDRLLWGSDWPFLGMNGDPAYTTSRLAAKLLGWIDDDGLAHRILVDNPARLYGFPSLATA